LYCKAKNNGLETSRINNLLPVETIWSDYTVFQKKLLLFIFCITLAILHKSSQFFQ